MLTFMYEQEKQVVVSREDAPHVVVRACHSASTKVFDPADDVSVKTQVFDWTDEILMNGVISLL